MLFILVLSSPLLCCHFTERTNHEDWLLEKDDEIDPFSFLISVSGSLVDRNILDWG